MGALVDVLEANADAQEFDALGNLLESLVGLRADISKQLIELQWQAVRARIGHARGTSVWISNWESHWGDKYPLVLGPIDDELERSIRKDGSVSEH